MTDPNKRFAELIGVCFISPETFIANFSCRHCGERLWQEGNICAFCHKDFNPDFSDPREVLKVIMEREDWADFVIFLERKDDWWYVKEFCERYITTPGLLRDKWIEWREAKTA